MLEQLQHLNCPQFLQINMFCYFLPVLHLLIGLLDLKEAYIADSESSSIRALDLKTGGSKLLAGGDPVFSENLFRVLSLLTLCGEFLTHFSVHILKHKGP